MQLHTKCRWMVNRDIYIYITKLILYILILHFCQVSLLTTLKSMKHRLAAGEYESIIVYMREIFTLFTINLLDN